MGGRLHKTVVGAWHAIRWEEMNDHLHPLTTNNNYSNLVPFSTRRSLFLNHYNISLFYLLVLSGVIIVLIIIA